MGVVSISGFTPGSKVAVVEINPREVSIQQLTQAVANTPGLHGKPYDAMLLFHVDNLNADTKKKIDEALKGVPGVDSAMVVDEKAGVIGIKFAKLTEGTGVRLGAIRRAFQEAGLMAQPHLPKEPTPS